MTKRTGLTGLGMLLLALCMLRGLPGAAAFAGEAETAVMAQTAAMADDPYRLVEQAAPLRVKARPFSGDRHILARRAEGDDVHRRQVMAQQR